MRRPSSASSTSRRGGSAPSCVYLPPVRTPALDRSESDPLPSSPSLSQALKKISEVSRAKGISPVDVIRSSDIPFADGTLAFKACRKFVQVYDQLRQLAESVRAVLPLPSFGALFLTRLVLFLPRSAPR